jgi:hypothetical protein
MKAPGPSPTQHQLACRPGAVTRSQVQREEPVLEVSPARHRRSYTQRLLRDVLVVAVKLGSDLADRHGGPASCTAEEILRSHVGDEALVPWEFAGLGPPWLHPDGILSKTTISRACTTTTP